MKYSAQNWVEKLQLQPHPEGGYFKETYRSSVSNNFDGFEGIRNVSTGIYFLLTKNNFSAFHRIKSDEMWHFYAGDALEIFVIDRNGKLEIIKLGTDLEHGEVPQAVVPANCWFASRVFKLGSFSLVGCTVAPGFDFADFEMAERDDLTKHYPQHTDIIRELTR